MTQHKGLSPAKARGARGIVVRAPGRAVASVLTKLDRFHLTAPDDPSYLGKDQGETSVLLELIAERYERRGLLITTGNQPFSGWNDVFPDPSMAVAAIDLLMYHSTTFKLNVASYRHRNDNDNDNDNDNKTARRRQLPHSNRKERQAWPLDYRDLPTPTRRDCCQLARRCS